jgi:hypothetical protein
LVYPPQAAVLFATHVLDVLLACIPLLLVLQAMLPVSTVLLVRIALQQVLLQLLLVGTVVLAFIPLHWEPPLAQVVVQAATPLQ